MACGLPFEPNIRIKLLGDVPVSAPKVSKPTFCLDVVANDRLAGVYVACKQGLDTLLEEGITKLRVSLRPSEDRFLEIACQAYRLTRSELQVGRPFTQLCFADTAELPTCDARDLGLLDL